MAPDHHRTAQSTIDAYWYVVRLNEPARLDAWLADHPHDAPYLRTLTRGRPKPLDNSPETSDSPPAIRET